MDRSTALSPLNAGEGRFNLTAGIAVRGTCRRAALKLGVDYYEEKGWIDSVFIFRGPVDRVKFLINYLEQNFGDK